MKSSKKGRALNRRLEKTIEGGTGLHKQPLSPIPCPRGKRRCVNKNRKAGNSPSQSGQLKEDHLETRIESASNVRASTPENQPKRINSQQEDCGVCSENPGNGHRPSTRGLKHPQTPDSRCNSSKTGRRSSLKKIDNGDGKRIGILTPVTFATPLFRLPVIQKGQTNKKGHLGKEGDSRRKMSTDSVCFSDGEERISSSLASDVSINDEKLDEEADASLDVSTEKEGENNIAESDEYDTDLEMDEQFVKDSVNREDRNIGKEVYLRACEVVGVAPQQRFLKMLTERSLSLRNRSLGPSAIFPLCAALKDNLRVERINLEGTDINEEGSQFIAEMLLDNITITHVNLANNSMGMRGAQVMGHVITVTENITHINLSGNKMDDKCAWYMSTGIGSNTTITHLDLSYNEFCEKAGTLIGGSLSQNLVLKHLNLSWNKIRGKGAVAIFQGLMFNATLEVLDLSWNGIGYEGSVALSKSLRKNVGLKELAVTNNRIDWRGADLIATGLKDNSTLTRLKIGYNPLTTTGCMDLLHATACNTSAICLLDASEVCVLGEADLLAATISRRRKFQFQHGGIVPSHDFLGARMEREINPMLRVIEYLRVLGLRPLELLKSFDKSSSSFELPRVEFVDKIRKIGVKLHKYEIEALANSVSSKGFDHDLINYRKLSMAVREVVREERDRKNKEKEEWQQIKSYHTQILQKGVPNPIGVSREVFGDLSDRSILRVENVYSPMGSYSSHVSPPTASTVNNDRSRLLREEKVWKSTKSLLGAREYILSDPEKKQTRRLKTANDYKHT